MQGLIQVDVTAAERLLAGWTHQLAPQTVREGAVAGRVWVDRAAGPDLALLQVNRRLYLAGSGSWNEATLARLGSTLFETLLPEAKAKEAEGFVLYLPEAYQAGDLQDSLFCGHTVYPGRHNSYELAGLTPEWQPPGISALPGDLRLAAVDADLLSNSGLRNYAALLEEMQSERESVADFAANSFGVCLLSADTIVTWCLSEYNLGTKCEVGIATDANFRQRGLAAITAVAMIHQAIGLGIQHIGWHCWQGNTASNATARKLGFQFVEAHDAFFVPA